MNRKASWKGVNKALDQLTEEELLALVDNASALKEFAAGLAVKLAEGIYVVPVSDKDVPPALLETTAKWRMLAAELGYTGPVAWKVREGFTLKRHAPKAGPCYKKFAHLQLQDWSLANDEPTKNAIVFWIPRLVADSTNKNATEQTVLLSRLRERLGLPAHHLADYGSAALLSGLILANFKRNGERVPLNQYWTRTDTLRSDSFRLLLGDFGDGGLDCWRWGGYRDGHLGCFPLGVELGF